MCLPINQLRVLYPTTRTRQHSRSGTGFLGICHASISSYQRVDVSVGCLVQRHTSLRVRGGEFRLGARRPGAHDGVLLGAELPRVHERRGGVDGPAQGRIRIFLPCSGGA